MKAIQTSLKVLDTPLKVLEFYSKNLKISLKLFGTPLKILETLLQISYHSIRCVTLKCRSTEKQAFKILDAEDVVLSEDSKKSAVPFRCPLWMYQSKRAVILLEDTVWDVSIRVIGLPLYTGGNVPFKVIIPRGNT